MKNLFLPFLFIILLSFDVFGQSINDGIQLFRSGDYDRAELVFEQMNTSASAYYLGRISFNRGNYIKAQNYFDMLQDDEEYSSEASYASVLSAFLLKDFSTALEISYQLKESSEQNSIKYDASTFYSDLLNYMTLDQRFTAFKQVKDQVIKLDIITSAMGKVDYPTALTLVNSFSDQAIDTLNQDLNLLKANLKDSTLYFQNYSAVRYPIAPRGMTYHIGVTLPKFELNNPQYDIVQSLYFGIQLATERFNSENSDKKIKLVYKNSFSDPSRADETFNDLVWNHNVDAIIGPLFTEVAMNYRLYADDFKIPMITPLSNSNDLVKDNQHVFQLNPNFYVQGQAMARYALNTTKMDTVAIIAERNSLGEQSALAFRDVMQDNDVYVYKYYVQDLESQGYDIREFTKIFDPRYDTSQNINIDAVYAPFTGSVAPTLINALLTEFEAFRVTTTVFGSEEWSTVDIPESRLNRTPVYYTQSFSSGRSDSLKSNFDSEYRLRFSADPSRYSYVGYDAANILYQTLKRVQNPNYLIDGLEEISAFDGLSTRIRMDKSHVNQSVSIARYGKTEE